MDPSELLTPTLIRDAERVRRYARTARSTVESLAQASEVYRSLLRESERKNGYPRLYRDAWELLCNCLERTDWQTLAEVERIFDRIDTVGNKSDVNLTLDRTDLNFSVWHLKWVLYAWSHQPGQSENLLALVDFTRAFVNMTPREADLRLVAARMDTARTTRSTRPYLFRLSTTVAGTIALTYQAPISGKVQHVRLAPGALLAALIETGDLYSVLVESQLPEGKAVLDGADLALVMAQLDYAIDRRAVADQLRDVRAIGRAEVYPLLRERFFAQQTALQLAPSSTAEKIGVTESYLSAYVSLSLSSLTTCFQCRSPTLALLAPLDNRLYCKQECYDTDWVNCY